MLTEQNGIQVDKFYPPTDWQYSFPEGYTRLEYLESTGTQYIDTGVTKNLSHTYRVKGEISWQDVTNRQLFGMQGYVYLGVLNGYYQIAQEGTSVTSAPATINNKDAFDITFDVPNNSCSYIVNNVSGTHPCVYGPNLVNFYLFILSNMSYECKCRLYSCQIYDNGTLVRNFVPAKRNSDNKPGMYDLVNDVFYVNQGTGEFVIGPELYSNNSQIDIRQKNNTNFVEKYKFNENNELVWANPQLNLSGPVGYTKVGNPTIVDNVASGFSSGNYIQLSESIPNLDINSKFEMILKLKFNGFNQAIFGGSNTYNIYISIDSSKRLYAYVYDNTNDNRIYTYIWSSALDDTSYWIKYLIENGKLSIAISNDNTNWYSSSIDLPQNFTYTLNSVLNFKSGFQGSIDLKETYIKVNDKLWFYGKNYTSENYAPVPAGLNYNNTTTPSIGYVNTQTQEFTPAPTDGIKYSQTRDIKVIPPEDNTITLLYGVKSDFSKYALFGLLASVSSGTYDVYIDDVLYATTASATQTDIDFSALGNEYVSIGTCTTPEELVLHKIVIKPTTSGETITQFRCARTADVSTTQQQGVLWGHFELDNEINLNILSNNSYPNNNCLAITALNDNLNVNSVNNSFRSVKYIKYLPKINIMSNNSISGTFLGFENIKRIIINNIRNIIGIRSAFNNSKNIEQICINSNKIENISDMSYVFEQSNKLKLYPNIKFSSNTTTLLSYLLNSSSLYPTKFDVSSATGLTIINTYGSSTYPMRGLRGLKVSNEAPFTGTSPQINVSYTGLDRDALVELFNSMPYNVGYTQPEGSAVTITDGVASGFSTTSYLEINKSFDYSKDFEMQFAITFNSFSSLTQMINFTGTAGVLAFNATNGKPNFLLQFTENGTNKTVGTYNASWANTQLNTKTYFRFGREGNTLFLKRSTDLVNWDIKISDIPDTYLPLSFTNLNIGTKGAPIDGSLDLNETYIKIKENNEWIPWFIGKAATTKRIDITAATGNNLTKVGTPTIDENGVASGFSSTNYLKFDLAKNVSNISEYVFKFKLTSEGLRNQYNYLFRRGNFQFSIYGSTTVGFYTPNMYLPTYNQNVPLTGFIPVVDNWYWVKYTYDGTTVNLYSSIDGINWTLRNTVTNVTVAGNSGTFYLGFADTNVNSYFGGAIDLNNTYIKVGQNYIVKGYLTDNDRLIATNKGWGITG